MDLAKNKLDRITAFWNNYVWNYKTIQKKVLWNAEVKTNYYGDILSYFSNTFELLKSNVKKKGYGENIFYWTGVMQIIYVHQDLLDEVLRIFKIKKSSQKDKNPNRRIRNELIGHPISRHRDKSFKSSVFWGNQLATKKIHYYKYSIKSGFTARSHSYELSIIINSHHVLLNKYFDIILNKINQILKKYLKQIESLEAMIENGINFMDIVTLTSQIHEFFFKQNELYNLVTLNECKNREGEHKRYKHVVNTFLSKLKESIKETNEDIHEITSNTEETPKIEENTQIPNIKIVVSGSENVDIDLTKQERDYNYELGKLYSRHPMFGIKYFKQEFKNDSSIIEELNNMEENYHNDLEYYSSYDYLKHLMDEKKLL